MRFLNEVKIEVNKDLETIIQLWQQEMKLMMIALFRSHLFQSGYESTIALVEEIKI